MREFNTVHWTKGTLSRDHIPACRSARFVVHPDVIAKAKLKPIKAAILKRKLENLQKEREEEATRKEEEKTNDSEQTKFDDKINELGKKLESLQKDKHKLFLLLKQVLQNEKKKQQAILLKKTQLEAKQQEETVKFENTEKTHSRRITSPGPSASRMYMSASTSYLGMRVPHVPQPQQQQNPPALPVWSPHSPIMPPGVMFMRNTRPPHMNFSPANNLIRSPVMSSQPSHIRIRRPDNRRGRPDRWW